VRHKAPFRGRLRHILASTLLIVVVAAAAGCGSASVEDAVNKTSWADNTEGLRCHVIGTTEVAGETTDAHRCSKIVSGEELTALAKCFAVVDGRAYPLGATEIETPGGQEARCGSG
jgi:hypothetical protein